MPKVPAWKRVKRQLDRAGAYGVTRVDFSAPDVIDGGKPILNFPERIRELRKQGYHVPRQGTRDGVAVYIWGMYQHKPADDLPVVSTGPAAETPPVLADDPAPTGTLFEVEHKPASPYQEAA